MRDLVFFLNGLRQATIEYFESLPNPNYLLTGDISVLNPV